MSDTDKTRPWWVKQKDDDLAFDFEDIPGRHVRWPKWWVGEARCGCSMCGDCCEDIVLSVDHGTIISVMNPRHPRSTDGKYRRDAAFINKNMRPTGKVIRHGAQVKQVLECAKFDTETRKCTAHNERPEVCRRYPWYGKTPERGDKSMKGRCSFLADAYKMLPIVEVRSTQPGACN